MGVRHHLHSYGTGMALSHYGHRSWRPKSDRVGIEHDNESRGNHRCRLEDGSDQQAYHLRTHLPFRPWRSIRLYGVHRPFESIHNSRTEHGPKRKLLGQRCGRELFQNIEIRMDTMVSLPDFQTGPTICI